MSKKKDPFTRGKLGDKNSESSSDDEFIRLKDGEHVELVFLSGLEGMISAKFHKYWRDRKMLFMHPCLGENCPSCQRDDEPRWEGFLSVYTKQNSPAVYPFTYATYNKLADLEDALGESLGGNVIRISRKGTFMKTRYTPTATGRSIPVKEGDDGKVLVGNGEKAVEVELPDIVSHLGPTTIKEVKEGLAKKVDSPFTDDDSEVEDESEDFGGEESATDEPAKLDEDVWGDL